MNVQVISVSKREQKVSKTGAAIFVLTLEDIRRSGMTNIPDLLRIVPGVNVARIDSNTWAISIRGFDTRYSDKVLVLIDGRSVYMPSFSGVYWDQQDIPPEDIARIEVIRGPGGTVWGTNAMDGVINIITKRSQDMVWTPANRQTVWMSAAPAIRQPSRQDADISYDVTTVPLDGRGFGVLKVAGNPMLKSEELRDCEIGYRAQLSQRLSLDVSVFRGYYRCLETAEPGVPYWTSTPGPLHEVFPLILESLAHARTYGGEVFATWKVANQWSIASAAVGDSPKRQFEVRDSFTLRHNLDWDTSVYFVEMQRDRPIPACTRVDTRIGWKPAEYTELSIAGRNLLRPLHLEFANAFEVDHTQMERSMGGKTTWRF